MNGSSSERDHQRLIDVADQPLRGRQGLDVVGIEAVEGAEIGEVEPAALGRVRIDVGQMVEIRRQRRLAVHGDRAGRARPTSARGGRAAASSAGAERQANRKTDHRLQLSTGQLRRFSAGRRFFSARPPRAMQRESSGASGAATKLLLDCRVEYGKRARAGEPPAGGAVASYCRPKARRRRREALGGA